MSFTKKFKNRFIEIIRQANLEETSFDSKIEYSAFVIYYKPEFFFKVSRVKDSVDFFNLTYITFKAIGLADYSPAHHVTVKEIFDHFYNWINTHVKDYKDELVVPDLWEEVSKINKKNYFKSDDSEFQPFSTDEQQQVRMALNEFKNRTIKEFNPTENEVKLITERLDYLADKVDKINRFDWKGLALSTLISIGITLSLDTGQGQKLFDWFRELIMIIPQIAS